MACVFRKMWKRRNRWVFENSLHSPNAILTAAKAELEEFIQAHETSCELVTVEGAVNRDIRC